jgi:hypothetical protein
MSSFELCLSDSTVTTEMSVVIQNPVDRWLAVQGIIFTPHHGSLMLPPPVIIDDSFISSPHPLNAETSKDEDDTSQLRGDEDSESDQAIFEDALDYFPDECCQEQAQTKKVFPADAATYLYGALKTHIDTHDHSSSTSDSTASIKSGSRVLSHTSRRTSMSSFHPNWSTVTVYTTSDRSSISLPESSHSSDSVPSPAGFMGISNTCSREGRFSKGVPWGFHGRDYVGPESRRHHLKETLRDKLPRNSTPLGRFGTRICNLFRKSKGQKRSK